MVDETGPQQQLQQEEQQQEHEHHPQHDGDGEDNSGSSTFSSSESEAENEDASAITASLGRPPTQPAAQSAVVQPPSLSLLGSSPFPSVAGDAAGMGFMGSVSQQQHHTNVDAAAAARPYFPMGFADMLGRLPGPAVAPPGMPTEGIGDGGDFNAVYHQGDGGLVMWRPEEELTVVIVPVAGKRPEPGLYRLNASYMDSRGMSCHCSPAVHRQPATEMLQPRYPKPRRACVLASSRRRTWSVVRSDAQFAALSDAILAALAAGTAPPPLRYPGPAAGADALERYLAQLLRSGAALASPDLYAFLAAPPDVVEEPVLIGEVVDEDSWTDRRVRSADPDAGRDPGRQSGKARSTVPGRGAVLRIARCSQQSLTAP
ncbi:hypothetical protein JKP88DRAFT_267040 [Tribonema minus]|uniref:PX domain-containing protein n=1 Tax=Tribonema minus TaxID=303371 RepID=A0A835ZJG0_9STRA|nr:hypothetical protein JKP88DRAFT_267040 [Tribonema minus]